MFVMFCRVCVVYALAVWIDDIYIIALTGCRMVWLALCVFNLGLVFGIINFGPTAVFCNCYIWVCADNCVEAIFNRLYLRVHLCVVE